MSCTLLYGSANAWQSSSVWKQKLSNGRTGPTGAAPLQGHDVPRIRGTLWSAEKLTVEPLLTPKETFEVF